MTNRRLRTLLQDLSGPLSDIPSSSLQAWSAGLDAGHAAVVRLLADACRVALSEEPSPGQMPDCSVTATHILFDFVHSMTADARAAVAGMQV